MDSYVYKGADVIGYFKDSKGRTQVFTTDGIYENNRVGKSEEWIKEHLKYFSKKQLKNYIDNLSDGYLLWKSIRAEYFKKENKMVESNTDKKVVVCAEVPDSSEYRTDAGRDYYWPLGEIELEEAQL